MRAWVRGVLGLALLGAPQAGAGRALEGEQGYSGFWQAFAGGRLVTGPGGRVYALFAGSGWE